MRIGEIVTEWNVCLTPEFTEFLKTCYMTKVHIDYDNKLTYYYVIHASFKDIDIGTEFIPRDIEYLMTRDIPRYKIDMIDDYPCTTVVKDYVHYNAVPKDPTYKKEFDLLKSIYLLYKKGVLVHNHNKRYSRMLEEQRQINEVMDAAERIILDE